MRRLQQIIINITLLALVHPFSLQASDLTENVKFLDVNMFIDGPCRDEDEVIYYDLVRPAEEYGLKAFAGAHCNDRSAPGERPSVYASLSPFRPSYHKGDL